MERFESVVNPEIVSQADEDRNLSLRPKLLQEFIGQAKVKEKLRLFIDAARSRQDALDHVLLAGPPGLGKTTLAHILAREMGSRLHLITGPNIEKKGDLAAVLTQLEPNDVLFIDEIHRLPRTLEEVLYSAMEDFKLDIILGQGPGARTVTLDLPKFTLIGATTRTGLLTSPLRDRFGVHLHLEFYPAVELEKILLRSAELLDLKWESESAVHDIAGRSRGTPRIANRLLRRVRDFAQVRTPQMPISADAVRGALELFEIDQFGLDSMDRKFLLALIDRFDGGPVGIESLAASIGEERETLEEVYEPFLVQEGFVQRTPRGRVALRRSYDHLGRDWEPKVLPTS